MLSVVHFGAGTYSKAKFDHYASLAACIHDSLLLENDTPKSALDILAYILSQIEVSLSPNFLGTSDPLHLGRHRCQRRPWLKPQHVWKS